MSDSRHCEPVTDVTGVAIRISFRKQDVQFAQRKTDSHASVATRQARNVARFPRVRMLGRDDTERVLCLQSESASRMISSLYTFNFSLYSLLHLAGSG